MFNFIGLKNLLYNEIKVFYGIFKHNNLPETPQHFYILLKYYFKRKLACKGYYKKSLIKFNDLKKQKKSNILFIIASGNSLNKIKSNEWKKINKFDSIGFNNTFFLKKINFSFHINRATHEGPGALSYANDYCKFFSKKVRNNSFFKKTIFLFPSGLVSNFPNQLLGNKFFNKKNKFLFYITNRKKNSLPSDDIENGLVHDAGTLTDAVNFGYCLNYKKIVLVGVDLYNNQHFFCPPNTTYTWDKKKKNISFSKTGAKGISHRAKHNTVNFGIIKTFGLWKRHLKRRGVALEIYNKRSLLKKHLTFFNWSKI